MKRDQFEASNPSADDRMEVDSGEGEQSLSHLLIILMDFPIIINLNIIHRPHPYLFIDCLFKS